VLTPSDSFERFFPPMFRFLTVLARMPGSMWLLAAVLRLRFLHRLPLTFGRLAKRPIRRATMSNYLDPVWRDAGIRRDLRKFLRGVHPRHTQAAATALGGFTRPVLLAWAPEDRLFPISLAQRLAGVLPDARVVEIADSYTFLPEDRPAELVKHIVEFASVMAD
jgi:pimeloyl-ACP methyl ester carboxylesterase